MNKPVSGSIYRNIGAVNEELRVYAQKDPNMTVSVNEGSFYTEGMNIVEFEGGNSPVIQAPTTGNEWVVVGINKVGTLFVANGIPAAKNPELPTIEKNQLPLAAIYLGVNSKKITGDMIFDIRPFLASGTYPGDHGLLENTDLPNCHPISAITGLQDKLDKKAEYADLSKLDDKIDNTKGTNVTNFVLNQAQTGEPFANVGVSVNRGDENSVGIRYNEKKTVWEFTNDGVVWNDFISSLNMDGSLKGATASTKGIAKLSVDPVDVFNPIAVGDNDPRLVKIDSKANMDDVYVKTDIDTQMATKANVSDTYNRKAVDDMLAGKMNVNTIYTEAEIDAKLLGKVNVGTVYTKAETDLQMVDKANVADVYAKADADKLFAGKANIGDSYLKADADKALAQKADNVDVYNKSEVDGALLLKANFADTYNKTEINDALALKANVGDSYLKADADKAMALKADVTSVYAKADADTQFAKATDVYVKADVDASLAKKADITGVYSVADADKALALKANVADVYSAKDVDGKLDSKANVADVYDKAEVDVKFVPYIKKDEVTLTLGDYVKSVDAYTKLQADALLNVKANTADVDKALALKADAATVYTQAVIDSKLANYATVSALSVIDTKKAETANVYDKAEMDAKLLDKANKAEFADLISKKVDDDDLIAYVQKTELDATLLKYAQVSAVNLKANTADVYKKTDVDSLVASKADATSVYTMAQIDTKLSTYALASDLALKASNTDVALKADKADLGNYVSLTSLTTTLTDYAKKADSVDNVVLISAGGKKFKLNVAEDGTLSTTPVA